MHVVPVHPSLRLSIKLCSTHVLCRHHAGLINAHLHFFEALSNHFAVPDVEFIVATFDVPTIRLDRLPAGQQPTPILRFCKSDHHADILVPDIHFQLKRFNSSLLSKVQGINTKWNWKSKKDSVFGRFTNYQRIVHDGLPSLYRKGFGYAPRSGWSLK